MDLGQGAAGAARALHCQGESCESDRLKDRILRSLNRVTAASGRTQLVYSYFFFSLSTCSYLCGAAIQEEYSPRLCAFLRKLGAVRVRCGADHTLVRTPFFPPPPQEQKHPRGNTRELTFQDSSGQVSHDTGTDSAAVCSSGYAECEVVSAARWQQPKPPKAFP